jgi:alanine racemase
MSQPLTHAEIDLAAYGRNIAALQRHARPGCRLMAVVKADAYGHGAVPMSRCAVKEGIEALAVARIEEALELRDAGITAPILVFGYTPDDLVEAIFEHDLTQTVWSLDQAKTLSSRAAGRGARARVHIKVDTGMGRLGFPAVPAEGEHLSDLALAALIEEIRAAVSLDGLEVEGLYTHFASADLADKAPTTRQLRAFRQVVRTLRAAGIELPVLHAANSAAFLDLPESHLDLARLGISTYGLLPSSEIIGRGVELEPVMRLVSTIIQLKRVPAGFAVSYGSIWRAPEPTTIATVAIGYADGLNRLLSSRGEMLVRGCRAPIVGRVCMDLTMLDVGHLPDVAEGDEVVVFGRQGNESILADELARVTGTINYEVLTSLTARVARVYKRS